MASIFLKPDHSILKKIAKKIPISQIKSAETKRIAELMLKIIQEEQTKHKKGVGLAAPQIGILKRIILVDVKAGDKKKMGDLKIFINPEIIWHSKKETEWYEGCFSTGQMYGIVKRSYSVKVRGFEWTPWGWTFRSKRYTGYVARIFQHEIDHLNGKLFISHIKDPDKLHKVSKKEFSLYRRSWKNWPRKYPLERLQNLGKNNLPFKKI